MNNVTAVQANGNKSSLPDETADVIYALDMFHMVSEPGAFLRELNRICKRTGGYSISTMAIKPGKRRKSKIMSSGAWEIVEEKKRYLKCSPAGATETQPVAGSHDPVRACGLVRASPAKKLCAIAV